PPSASLPQTPDHPPVPPSPGPEAAFHPPPPPAWDAAVRTPAIRGRSRGGPLPSHRLCSLLSLQIRQFRHEFDLNRLEPSKPRQRRIDVGEIATSRFSRRGAGGGLPRESVDPRRVRLARFDY